MTLSDLASLASVVSGLAVLVSLVFLYFQMRQLGAQLEQTEKNQRTMINESYVARAGDSMRWMAEPANVKLMGRVTQGERSFAAEELQSLHIIFRMQCLNALAAQQHYEAGLIDRTSHDSVMLVLKSWVSQPVYRAMWVRQALISAPPFRRLVDDMIRETPLATPVDVVANFNSDLAKVLAESSGELPVAAK